MVVTWQCRCSEEELDWMTGFEIKWRKEGEAEWSSKTTKKESRELTLTDLADGEYELSVCSLSEPGSGPVKETSFIFRTA